MSVSKLKDYYNTSIAKSTLVNCFLNHHSIFKKSTAGIKEATQLIVQSLFITIHKNDVQEVEKIVRVLFCQFSKKFQKCNRHLERFKQNNKAWLQGKFRLPSKFKLASEIPSTSIKPAKAPKSLKPFAKMSIRQKHRTVAALTQIQAKHLTNEIVLAASRSAKIQKQCDLSALLKKAIESPTRPYKILKKMQQPELIKVTPDEALSLILDRGLGRDTYEEIQKNSKAHGSNIYPYYKKVAASKLKCRPPESSIYIDETCAYVELQHLLEHTAERLVNLQKDVFLHIFTLKEDKEICVNLLCSWGFDGSSGQSHYKQHSKNKDSIGNDSHLLVTTMTPLRMVTASNPSQVIWNNSTPQSIRSCRPVKIEFKKESKEAILDEMNRVNTEISNLEDLTYSFMGRIVKVTFQLQMTVIDGKVLSVITGTTSCQLCPICGAKPSEFNDFERIKNGNFVPNNLFLLHGICPLHSRIRFLEFVLHIAYRLNVKVWKATKQYKLLVATRKSEIQTRLKNELNVLVDFPKSGGGSTNDGNTSRRCFENYKLFSSILGLNEDLIFKFKNILTAINCTLPLNPDTFQEVCFSAAKLCIELYPWYPLSSSVHKVLVHGHQIIRATVLPLGMLSEEGAESRNKIYRSDRLHHSRKTSRVNSLNDVFNRAMDTSDPVISAISLNRRQNKTSKLPLPSEVIYMLQAYKYENQQSISSQSSDDSMPDSHGNEDEDLDELDSFSLESVPY